MSLAHAQLAPYEQCHSIFQGIINGTLSVGPVNNVTIWDSGLLYEGPFDSLDPNYPRRTVITPTFRGKKAPHTYHHALDVH
jgi:hypothetical protein